MKFSLLNKIVLFRKIVYLTVYLLLNSCFEREGNIAQRENSDENLIVIKTGDVFDSIRNVKLAYKVDTLVGEVLGEVGEYSLTVKKIADYSQVQLNRLWSITDSSYVPPNFRTIEQKLELKNLGQKSFLQLYSKICVFHSWPSEYIDTVTVTGRLLLPVK